MRIVSFKEMRALPVNTAFSILERAIGDTCRRSLLYIKTQDTSPLEFRARCVGALAAGSDGMGKLDLAYVMGMGIEVSLQEDVYNLDFDSYKEAYFGVWERSELEEVTSLLDRAMKLLTPASAPCISN